MWEEGRLILAAAPDNRNLTLARAGTLPFFLIACAGLYALASRLFDPRTAAGSVAFFSLLPPILGHAGLATTDMALTAGIAVALPALLSWLRAPSPARAMLLGAATAFAILCKFSALPFLPAATAGMLLPLLATRPTLLRRTRWKHLGELALAACVAALLIWATYHFSVGRVRGTGPIRPAPEFWAGLKSVRWHNRTGQLSFLMGRTSQLGFFWFYPVCIALKTQIAWLLFVGAGIAGLHQDRRMLSALGLSLGILAAAMAFGHINLGIRHILPVYLGFSIVASAALQSMLRHRATTVLATLAGLWLLASTTVAHPNYLAYFNEFAADHPERFLIDSDLDWGQDVLRLQNRLAAVHAESVAVLPFASSPHGIALTPFSLDSPSPGWNAADITPLTLQTLAARARDPKRTFWFERLPPERIGQGILLWYAPAASH
jgi:4-amino-4-deoxy-L-arabinose transferase-like glycosyltransferase